MKAGRFWLAVLVSALLVAVALYTKPPLAVSCATPPEGVGPPTTALQAILTFSLFALVVSVVIAAGIGVAKLFRAPLQLGAFAGAFAIMGGLVWVEWETFYSTDSCGNPFWARVPNESIWLYVVGVCVVASYAFVAIAGRAPPTTQTVPSPHR